MTRFAWIGLGNMGAPMAGNLVASGHPVRGYDLSDAAREDARRVGVDVVGSIAEAVADADVVVTMLPKGQHVRDVLSQDGGVFSNARPGTLIMDSSTVDIETSRWCHEEAPKHGMRFVDAPVSGGTSGAAAATLAFMIGGSEADVAEALEHVKPMSGKAFAAGGPTAGIAAKIANNMMLFITQMAASEGSQLAKHLGLDPKTFWEITTASSGMSWSQQTWYPVAGIVPSAAANNNFEASFRADLALKDVTLAVDAGKAAGLHLEAASLAQEQLHRLRDEGLGDKDCTLVVKYVTPGKSQAEI